MIFCCLSNAVISRFWVRLYLTRSIMLPQFEGDTCPLPERGPLIYLNLLGARSNVRFRGTGSTGGKLEIHLSMKDKMLARESVLEIQKRVNCAVIGQERVVERLIIALLVNGNVLLEGLPGLAKTRAIKSLSQALESEFRRIQFTPDLLPSDVTGGEIYRTDPTGTGSFEFRKGPIFGNLVLADEINRAPAKVQSALLEAMEERQVTVSGTRYPLPDLFMVLATQNPIEQEGTYPLPEAQMDRFLMHVRIDYPSDADEVKVLRLVRAEQAGTEASAPEKVPQQVIFDARREIDSITTADAVENYVVALVA